MNDAQLLTFHRQLVGMPSISHQERPLVDWLQGWFERRGLRPERMGNNLVVTGGAGDRCVCLNSHVDTVPAGKGWTRPPHEVEVTGGRVYGLGSNDAKASVAAMTAALLRVLPDVDSLGVRVMLALVVEEETGGDGAELVVRTLAQEDRLPDEVVIGEPTSLDIVVAQKGLLVLELVATGTSCHAAHARARGMANPVRTLAGDILALKDADLGPDNLLLGPVTLEPTVLSSGTARNTVPDEARCVLDVRTNPEPSPEGLVERISKAVGGRVEVRSDRLRPCSTALEHPLVRSARAVRPEARVIGSRTLSDWVYFSPLPAIKVGPGATERSHGPDEFVLEAEVVEGAAFYEALLRGL